MMAQFFLRKIRKIRSDFQSGGFTLMTSLGRLGPLYQHRLTLISPWIGNDTHYKVFGELIIHSQLQRCSH